MTPGEINLAIAEAVGTHRVERHQLPDMMRLVIYDKKDRVMHVRTWDDGMRSEIEQVGWTRPLDYHGSLDACAEMEAVLITTGRWIEYVKNLARVAKADTWENFCRWTYGDEDAFLHGMIPVIRATAPQRCEAFLRTLGKWVEPDSFCANCGATEHPGTCR